jgi:putative redox protein
MENELTNDLVGHIGIKKYLCTITWSNGEFVMDEPESIGGENIGPDPYTTLLASLAGCSLSTLRMYIDRKEWYIPSFEIKLNMVIHKEPEFYTEIKREFSFPDNVTEEQKKRLLVIAGKCPISKLLENKIVINTN